MTIHHMEVALLVIATLGAFWIASITPTIVRQFSKE